MSGLSVLFLTHAAGTPDLGPNLRVYTIGKYLAAAGAAVTIIGSGTFHKYADGRVGTARITEQERDGMRLAWLRTVGYRHRSIRQLINQTHFPLRLLLDWRRLAVPAPDVIVASSPPPFVAFAAAWLGRRVGAPWVFEMRDLWPLVLREVGSFGRYNPYIVALKATERFAISRADRLVVVKPGDRDYVREEYGRTEGVQYIPNGIDPGNLPGARLENSAIAERTPPSKIRICYVGALTDYYVLDEFVAAFARVREERPDIELVVAGNGPRLAPLRELVDSERIADVIFTGYLDRPGVTRLLAESHIGYVGVRGGRADRHGISTNKLFEYMFMSLPVLACYETDHDPVENAGCGITVPRADPDQIARGLRTLLDLSAEARAIMGERGRRYVLDQHYLPQLADRYGLLLREVAAEYPRRHR